MKPIQGLCEYVADLREGPARAGGGGEAGGAPEAVGGEEPAGVGQGPSPGLRKGRLGNANKPQTTVNQTSVRWTAKVE